MKLKIAIAAAALLGLTACSGEDHLKAVAVGAASRADGYRVWAACLPGRVDANVIGRGIAAVKEAGGGYGNWAARYLRDYDAAQWGHLSERQRYWARRTQTRVANCTRLHWNNL
ncbi:MAG: hypothetical protein GDA52_01810 [Rhodobacteraceae bacterium]|nr:hypothetical protein [Paracoccaceae bacterium]